MTKQTARKWTFKGTSASLAVVMAFGMTPAATTMAMAAEEQSNPVVREASAEEMGETAATETSVASILSAAASYSYDDGYAYGMSASVVGPDGTSVTSYYEGEALASIGDDMARFLGALYRAEGASVDSIVYDDVTYVWEDSVGLKGSNWAKQGTTEDQITQAKQDGNLSDYTLVGAIAKKISAGAGADAEEQSLQIASLPLELKKGDESYSVSFGADAGSITDAVGEAVESSTVILNKDWNLDGVVSLSKDLSIEGNGRVITGKADDAGTYFEITAGSFALSDATLRDFGGAAATQSGNGAIKVPSTADANTTVTVSNVNFSNFNRSAIDIEAGTFEISGGSIDCKNDGEQVLTKGIKVGGSSQLVSGDIAGVSITNSDSDYAEWTSAAIEVYNHADVSISDVTISNAKNGISVDNCYFDAMGDTTVNISGDCDIDASEGSAVRVYGKADAKSDVAVAISGGKYAGAVKVIDDDADSIVITGGTFSQDPSAYVASGYEVSESDGAWVVAKDENDGGAGGGNGGGSTVPGDGDGETVTNPDGSTTTTVTEEDGSTVSTTVSEDGSVTTVVEKDAEGNVASVEATVEGDKAPEATVALPMEPIAAASSEEAPEISVKAPAGTKVSVPVAKAEGAEEPALGCVLVMVGADGSETAMPKTGVSEDGLALEVPGDCALKVVDASAGFPDVEASDWFAGVADFASARNILSGVVLPDGTAEFQGDLGTTRAMFVTMLNRLELEPKASEGAPSFSDVDASDWFSGTASWAAEEGLLSGYAQPDGTVLFGGEDPVTREQVAVFLMRYAEWLGLDTSARAESAAPDASEVSGWAAEAVSWAVAEGYVLGDEGTGAVRPADGASRAEAAAVVMRFVNSLY